MKLADLSAEHAYCVCSLLFIAARRAAVSVALRRIAFTGREEKIMLQALLTGVEIVVAAFECVELFVGAALDDLSLFHHQNLVGAPDGGEPVRDHECGAALHEIRKSLLDHLLGFGIETGSGFIEDQDAG